MRLIDADSLKRDFNVFYGGVGHAAIATWIINDAPGVDAVGAVHGRWIEKTNPCRFDFKYNCSACHSGSDLATKFCPYCGAKMDGDSND